MPFYLYVAYVRRVRKLRSGQQGRGRWPFEPHYPLAALYDQEVRGRADVPIIDGFQCPTCQQEPEDNSMFKAMLFTPWVCKGPTECTSVLKFDHLLASTNGRPATFARAWRLRRSEIAVLAARAEARARAARKILVLQDTLLFRKQVMPLEEVQEGEELAAVLRKSMWLALRRNMPSEALRCIMRCLGAKFSWHDEQCTLAEFSAFLSRDIAAHIDFAAEARVKAPAKADKGRCDEDEEASSDEEQNENKDAAVQIDDIGGAGLDHVEDEFDENDHIQRVPLHRLADHVAALGIAFRTTDLKAINQKKRLSAADKQLLNLTAAYKHQLELPFGLDWPEGSSDWQRMQGIFLGSEAQGAIATQRSRISLAKKQISAEPNASEAGFAESSGAVQPAEAAEVMRVPLSLALRGPGVCAWDLVTKASCTEEQIDAVALIAFSLQEKFDKREDLSSPRLPVASSSGNHRALWLGGGGVGKTRTLRRVIEPLATTYFGDDGYLATAQSNLGARNLGPRGRTLHVANGLTAASSLRTAALRLNEQSSRKMQRLKGNLGVEACDEISQVGGDLFHASALRTTYCRRDLHALRSEDYMRPQETWGRLPAFIACGDFLQLPPVPETSSLLNRRLSSSYEHQQGQALLAGFEHVVDFVEMQRFDDPLLLEILHSMRTPGGKTLSEEAWRALERTQVRVPTGVTERADGASQPVGREVADSRLNDAVGWYESAYEWAIVSFAMQLQTRLSAKRSNQVLYYVQAVDRPAVDCGRVALERMLATPNVTTTRKLMGLLPIYVGMEVVLTESILPPFYVPGATGRVLGIEPHPDEPPVRDAPGITTEGVVLLRFMPICVYVLFDESQDFFLRSSGAPETDSASQPVDLDDGLKGVLAIEPVVRSWRWAPDRTPPPGERSFSVPVNRTQVPLLPAKQSTLHGLQGKTTEPGLIAHWQFPPRLSRDSLWLAHYVILSRVRRLSALLSFGLPQRSVLEGGPPQALTDAFAELFEQKIADTKIACDRARERLGWPPRHRAT